MITSVVTRSRLRPPTFSWPQTPGCHIPGFILWTCVLMARDVGGLWGGCHPWAEACPLWAQPHTLTMGNITNPAKSTRSQLGLGSQCTRIPSDDHGLHFPGTDPDPTAGQACKTPPLLGRTVFASLCKWRQKARAVWSAFCNHTGKFFSTSQG